MGVLMAKSKRVNMTKLLFTSTIADLFSLMEISGEEVTCDHFSFQLVLQCVPKTKEINLTTTATNTLGQAVSFGYPTPHGERWFHGHVETVSVESDRQIILCVVPWLRLLQYDRGHATFLNRTVPDVINETLQAFPFAKFRWDITRGNYHLCDRVVRFDESTCEFVTRLAAQHGIGWYWEHDRAGASHTLVFCDGSGSAPQLEGGVPYLRHRVKNTIQNQFAIHTWRPMCTIGITQLSLVDYDKLNPRVPINEGSQIGALHSLEKLPAMYAPAQVQSVTDAKSLVKSCATRERLIANRVTGTGNAPQMAAGYTFQTQAAEGEFYLTRVTHRISITRSRFYYENEFECVKDWLPPPVPETMPRIAGTFPARVVGSETQKDASQNSPRPSPVFTDDRGYVRVKFPWHQSGEDSGWVRVAHPGGQMRIPRIGEEVYVVWEYGDPDRPVVIASSYPVAEDRLFEPNTDPLPVVVRQEFPNGTAFNEVRFDSATKNEKLSIHAGQDSVFQTTRDHIEEIGANRQLRVEKNSTTLVHGRATELCKKQRVVRVNKTMVISTGGALVQRSKKKVIISAPEIVLTNGNSFIRIGSGGVVIEGKPFTRINCGGSATDSPDAPVEEPKKLPKPTEKLLLPKHKQPLLLPKPKS